MGECIGQYWRPNFDHHMYPYLPAHVTRPKEVRKLYVVPLQEKAFFEVRLRQKCCSWVGHTSPTASRLSACVLSFSKLAQHPTQIPKNQALTAVPLFELYENAAKFGAVIAGIPVMLSRLRLTLSGTGRLLAPLAGQVVAFFHIDMRL